MGVWEGKRGVSGEVKMKIDSPAVYTRLGGGRYKHRVGEMATCR